MHAENVIQLYTLLLEHGVQVWLDGGWGIDALLQQQTRPHKDLDLLVQLADLGTMTALLAEQGFIQKELWSENRWVAYAGPIHLVGRETPAGQEVATAFVLKNANGHELDVHVLQFDARGYGIAAWNTNFVYPPDAFEGSGFIANMPVRCLSAQMQMRTHTGYLLQAKDLQAVRYLHERFGVAYLEEHLQRFTELGM